MHSKKLSFILYRYVPISTTPDWTLSKVAWLTPKCSAWPILAIPSIPFPKLIIISRV